LGRNDGKGLTGKKAGTSMGHNFKGSILKNYEAGQGYLSKWIKNTVSRFFPIIPDQATFFISVSFVHTELTFVPGLLRSGKKYVQNLLPFERSNLP
jgi:hypothetical protein